MPAALVRKYDRPNGVRSCGRGGAVAFREIVIGMSEMIEMVLATVGWIAGVSVLLVMALLPLLERFGNIR